MTIVLSICFITFGAFLMYGTGEVLPDSSSEFANKLINLYTQSLGLWSYFIIAIAAFCVMFSTTIAVFDGYSRSIEKSFSLLFNFQDSEKIYLISLFVIAIGAYLIIWKFIGSFKQLIDLATTISFLIAPFCAVANYIVVNSSDIPIDKRPPYWLNILALLGIVFLIGFSVLFCFFL